MANKGRFASVITGKYLKIKHCTILVTNWYIILYQLVYVWYGFVCRSTCSNSHRWRLSCYGVVDNASSVCLVPGTVQERGFWTSGQRLTPNCGNSFSWKPNSKTTIPFAYTNWDRTQPDCTGNPSVCVQIWPGRGSCWNDISCATKMCVLCEYGPF